jgi:hypothetical protein
MWSKLNYMSEVATLDSHSRVSKTVKKKKKNSLLSAQSSQKDGRRLPARRLPRGGDPINLDDKSKGEKRKSVTTQKSLSGT